MNVTDFKYASNFRSTCYECDKIEHNMRNCADIDALINQEKSFIKMTLIILHEIEKILMTY